MKASFVKTKNNFNFSDVINTQNFNDSSRSNDFILTENIYAAYINYTIKIKKWDLQAGLRAEQTETNGLLSSTNIQTDKKVKRKYLDLFPSFGASYQVNANNGLNLNYSRRIQRPGLQQPEFFAFGGIYDFLDGFEMPLDFLEAGLQITRVIKGCTC